MNLILLPPLCQLLATNHWGLESAAEAALSGEGSQASKLAGRRIKLGHQRTSFWLKWTTCSWDSWGEEGRAESTSRKISSAASSEQGEEARYH
jgi:hypothetical protein